MIRARIPPAARRSLPVLALAVPLLGACAAPGADVHLAPIYTRISTAGDGREREILFGLGTAETAPEQGHPVPGGADDWESRHALRPFFYSHTNYPEGRSTTWTLPPLGITIRDPVETTSIFVPLWLYRSRANEAYGERDYEVLVLTGTMMKRDDGVTRRGWMPFIGAFDTFLTYQDVLFICFPLYLRAERNGRRSKHFLFPILGWTTGGGESSFRLWPLFGWSKIEGRFDRWFALWPFLHHHQNFLGGDGELPETKWMFFPFYGTTRRGSFRSHAVLWPFFGIASDPRNGFWALDAPWPLVRLQRRGQSPTAEERTRLWPLYSRVVADRLTAESWLWPFFHKRHETYPRADREGTYLLPFYHHWERVDAATAEESSYRLIWPLYQRAENVDRRTRTAFPALSFLGRHDYIDHHYAWLWELYTRTERDWGTSERTWGGLWRRERDAAEDRASLTGLWSRRRYREDGARVRETSLLFGLVRWRVHEGEGASLLPPAFPGPGWPAERATTKRPAGLGG